MDAVLVGTDLDEEVGTRDTATCIAQFGSLVVALLALLAGTGSGSRYLDGDGIGRNRLTSHHDMGRRDRIGTVLRCTDDISKGNRGRRTGVTIDHLITRLHGTVRTDKYL